MLLWYNGIKHEVYMDKGIKTFSLRLDNTQYQKLRFLSFIKDKSISLLVRDAIDEYIVAHQEIKPGQEWFWSETWQKDEREVENELAAGDFQTFDTMEDFLKNLE